MGFAKESMDLFDKAEKEYSNENYYEAFDLYYSSAERDNTDAMIKLAKMYNDGLVDDKDPYNAEFWYKKAVLKNDYMAVVPLANLYCNELKSEDNLKKAFKTLTEFCENKSPDILYTIGFMIYAGYAGFNDLNLACQYFSSAEKHGYEDLLYWGVCQINPKCDFYNLNDGLQILEQLAEKENIEAILRLAAYYYHVDESKTFSYSAQALSLGVTDISKEVKRRLGDSLYEFVGE